MEKIILNATLTECIEESSLWGVLLEINMLFPEQTKEENLVIAKDIIIWLYKDTYISFYKGITHKEVDFFTESFLLKDQNWAVDAKYIHSVFITLTDAGESFYDNFMRSYEDDLKQEGLIRKGIRYNLVSSIFEQYKKSGYLFWVSSLVALLGMQPVTIDSNLVKYISNDGERFCIVDVDTNTITALSLPSNFA